MIYVPRHAPGDLNTNSQYLGPPGGFGKRADGRPDKILSNFHHMNNHKKVVTGPKPTILG